MIKEEIFYKNGNTIKYLIDFPDRYDEKKKYPVILYLHGYGFVGKGTDYLKERCPVRRERIPAEKKFILIVPLCEKISWITEFETVIAFIDYIYGSRFCDRKRTYLSGSSMGGYAAWVVLLERKRTFAAALICCGGGQYWAARTGAYNDIPLRLVHGGKDATVLPRESEIMASAVNQAGGKAEVIIHDDLAHDVWTRTFTSDETYDWLLSNERN